MGKPLWKNAHNQTIYLDLLKRKTTSKQSQIFDRNHRLKVTIFSLFVFGQNKTSNSFT